MLNVWLKDVKDEGDIIIAGGDWNVVQNRKIDTCGVSYTYSQNEYFKHFQQNNSLIDIWRQFYPSKRQFTWRQMSLGIYSRLDYWLISRHVTNMVYSTDIRPALKCDHNAISLKLKVRKQKRGKGYWKINNSLLNDVKYVSNVKNVIQSVRKEYSYLDVQLRWEICKIKIKEFSIKYAKICKSRKKCIIPNLKRNIEIFVRKLMLVPTWQILKILKRWKK